VVIFEEPMALAAGRLTTGRALPCAAKPSPQWARRGELLGGRRDGDDRLALKVLMNAQNRCSGAAQLLDLPAVFFDDRDYLLRCVGYLLGGFYDTL